MYLYTTKPSVVQPQKAALRLRSRQRLIHRSRPRLRVNLRDLEKALKTQGFTLVVLHIFLLKIRKLAEKCINPMVLQFRRRLWSAMTLSSLFIRATPSHGRASRQGRLDLKRQRGCRTPERYALHKVTFGFSVTLCRTTRVSPWAATFRPFGACASSYTPRPARRSSL